MNWDGFEKLVQDKIELSLIQLRHPCLHDIFLMLIKQGLVSKLHLPTFSSLGCI